MRQQAVAFETVPTVDRGISYQSTARSAPLPQNVQSCLDQCSTDACTLNCWIDGNWPKAKPSVVQVVDCNGREGDVPNDFSLLRQSHQRQSQLSRASERSKNGCFRSVAERHWRKGLHRQCINGVFVSWNFGPDCRVAQVLAPSCEAVCDRPQPRCPFPVIGCSSRLRGLARIGRLLTGCTGVENRDFQLSGSNTDA